MARTTAVPMSLTLMLFTACGGDDGDGDTLLTGLSGFLIAMVVIFFVVRAMRKRT